MESSLHKAHIIADTLTSYMQPAFGDDRVEEIRQINKFVLWSFSPVHSSTIQSLMGNP